MATATAESAASPQANANTADASSRPILTALAPLKPDLHERAWASVPHPTLPLIATAHGKATTVFSLSTLAAHSSCTGGHTCSVRSVAWKPNLPPHKLCLVSGSFDSSAGIWRWDGDAADPADSLEVEVTAASASTRRKPIGHGSDDDNDDDDDSNSNSNAGGAGAEWEFTLVLEGHDSEIKSCAFNPSGSYLATCSRDKSVWIWEDIGATEADDEWETIAVLNEHEGDVKAVAWCPDVPGRNARRNYSPDVLASASYDNTVRVWREDNDGEWVCVAVLEGHEGTVWGVQWEPKPRPGDRFPRLMTFSADGTIRVWSIREDDDQDDGEGDGSGLPGARSSLGGIPNTMRRSLREDWTCTAVLPKAHNRDIYAVSWSGDSGLVASTGSDGILALYGEFPSSSAADAGPGPDADADADEPMADAPQTPAASPEWRLLAAHQNAHGPYEVNHVTWCKRYDAGSSRRGEEEMLVTTGDNGVVQPWQVDVPR